MFLTCYWNLNPDFILLMVPTTAQLSNVYRVKGFEVNGKRVPNDVPAKETILTFSLVSLVLYGVSAYMLWRQCGGLRLVRSAVTW